MCLLVTPLVINDLSGGQMLFPFLPDGEKWLAWSVMVFKNCIMERLSFSQNVTGEICSGKNRNKWNFFKS